MKSFFETEGKLSMMRLLSFVTVIGGLAIGIVAVIVGKVNAEVTALSIGLVSAGIAGKAIQKVKE